MARTALLNRLIMGALLVAIPRSTDLQSGTLPKFRACLVAALPGLSIPSDSPVDCQMTGEARRWTVVIGTSSHRDSPGENPGKPRNRLFRRTAVVWRATAHTLAAEGL